MKTISRSKRAPKQLTAVQASRHLRMVHRQHSGHLVHRRHTSYPVLAMIVLCVGVLIFSWTRFVSADTFVYPGPIQSDYDVHVRVPGPPPTEPATIDSPLDGDVFTDLPITVKGTCPLNTYVSLMRNNVFSGAGICDADGKYSITTGLFKGVNQLIAQVYSPTDVPGPPSNTVMVTYNPPLPPPVVTPGQPVPTGDSSSKKPSGSRPKASPVDNGPGTPLILKTDFKYQGVFVGAPTDWQLDVEGGTGPYAISVAWGDGTTSVISRSHAGAFALQHKYKKAGKYKGSYTAVFTVSDADGTQSYLQLITIVNNPPAGAGATNPSGGQGIVLNGSPAYLEKLVGYIWPGYGMVILMLTSFWLGERRELRHLQPYLSKNRHRNA